MVFEITCVIVLYQVTHSTGPKKCFVIKSEDDLSSDYIRDAGYDNKQHQQTARLLVT